MNHRFATQLIMVGMQIDFAYRFRMLLWMSQSVIWCLIFPFLWLASYGGQDQIAGFTRSDIITYFIGIIVLEYIVESYVNVDVRNFVHDGRLTAILLKPVNMVTYFFYNQIGFRFTRAAIFIITLSVVFLLYPHVLSFPTHLSTYPLFFVGILLANLIAFNIKFMLGCIAFWVEETAGIDIFYWFISYIFVGWVGPIDFFPLWFQHLSALLPFQYILYFPLSIFLEQQSLFEIGKGLVFAGAWCVLLVIARRFLFARAIQRYNAVGG